MSIQSLRYASRPAGGHRRARSARTVRIRALPGILALALALGAGLGAVMLTLPGHDGAHPAQVTARQQAGRHAPSAGFTAVTKAAPKPFMY